MSQSFILEVAFPERYFPATRHLLPMFASHMQCKGLFHGYLRVDFQEPGDTWYDPTARTDDPSTLLLRTQTLAPEECTPTFLKTCDHCELPNNFLSALGAGEVHETRRIATQTRELLVANLLCRHWPSDYKAAHVVVCALTGALMRQEGWDILRVQRLLDGICSATGDKHMELWAPIIQRTWTRLVAGDANLPGFRRLIQIYGERGYVMQQALCHWLSLERRIEYRSHGQGASITPEQWESLGVPATASRPLALPGPVFSQLEVLARKEKQSEEEYLTSLIRAQYDALRSEQCPS